MPTRLLQISWPFRPEDESESLSHYKALSCDGIELAGTETDLLNLGNSQAPDTLPGPVRAWSIERYPAGHLCDNDELARENALKTTTELIPLALAHGVGRITIAPAVVASEMARRVDYGAALNRTATAFEPLLRMAERFGIKLCLRAGAYGFLTSPPELRELVARLNSPRVGVDLDAVSSPGSTSWEDWVRTLRSNIEVIGIPPSAIPETVLSALEAAAAGRPFERDLVFRLAAAR